MKKIFYTAILSVMSLVTFTSCEDELTKNPYDSLSGDVIFSTPEGFSNAIRGIYSGATSTRYYGGAMFSDPDILTDNVIISANGRQSKSTLFEWTYGANNTPNLYDRGYKLVRRANAILENIDKLSGPAKSIIQGEAFLFRGLAHFDMVRTYAKIPTQSTDANTSLGIAYVTTVDPNQKPARNTVAEVYTKVIEDLNKAVSLLPTSNVAGRFTKNTANGLLSRVYLYNGEYQKAIDAANAVSGASVSSISNFPGLWKDETTEGILGQILIRIIDNTAIGTQYSQTSPTNGVRSEYVVSYDFYNLFKDNDVRKSTYISTSPYAGNQYNHVAKYFGKTGQVNNIVNAKVIRMAEVMLNKAEAYTKLPSPNYGAALVALDAVRSQRYTGFVSGGETGATLEDAIALERRLELAFEGHRFYDIKRKGMDIVRSATNGDLADGSGTPTRASSLVMPAGDHKFQLPIPLAALNSNPNLVQNTGY